MAGICYSILKNRIEDGCLSGFQLKEENLLKTDVDEELHYVYLKAIDSTVEDSNWGSISFEGEFEENMVCFLYVVARNEAFFYRDNVPRKIEGFLCDENESHEIKKRFMEKAGAKRVVNQENTLLYDQQGRYLYFFLEVLGRGKAVIKNLRVEQEGDNFMNTFPDIYRQRNSFFHRYMSVFSTIYNEFEEKIEELPRLLDVDLCPVSLLPVYAGWMGIEIKEDFFEEEVLRELVKNIYQLNRLKGTKAVLERIIEILLKEKPLILERNTMVDYVEAGQMADFERLYGNSSFDVTILIQQELSENIKNQLTFILDQYKPVRSRLYVIGLKRIGNLDTYSYMDMNAKIWEKGSARLDEKITMDSVIVLQE